MLPWCVIFPLLTLLQAPSSDGITSPTRHAPAMSPMRGSGITPVFTVDVVIDVSGWDQQRGGPSRGNASSDDDARSTSSSDDSNDDESAREEALALAGIRFKPEPEMLKQVCLRHVAHVPVQGAAFSVVRDLDHRFRLCVCLCA